MKQQGLLTNNTIEVVRHLVKIRDRCLPAFALRLAFWSLGVAAGVLLIKYKNPQFTSVHKNVKILLNNQRLVLLLQCLVRSSVDVYSLYVLFGPVNAKDLVMSSYESCLLTFGIPLTAIMIAACLPVVLAIERSFALFYYNDYESRKCHLGIGLTVVQVNKAVFVIFCRSGKAM